MPPAHVGLPRAGKTVTAELDDTCFRILDQHDTMLTVVPRTDTAEVTRYKVVHSSSQTDR